MQNKRYNPQWVAISDYDGCYRVQQRRRNEDNGAGQEANLPTNVGKAITPQPDKGIEENRREQDGNNHQN